MRPASVVELVHDRLAGDAQAEAEACRDVDALMSGDSERDRWFMPRPEGDRKGDAERLRRLAGTPLLRLIVEETAQHLVCDGVTSDSGRDTSAMWSVFERNGFPSRQGSLYSAALAYGEAYMLALPGLVPGQDATSAALSMHSPKTLHVTYGDRAEDEWPLYALRVIPQPSGPAYRLIDEESVHYLATEDGRLEYVESRPHGLGVCPVIRYAPNADIDGRSVGDPRRFEVPARRHAKTTHDRLMAQHYNSWKVRTATGLEEPGSAEEAQRTRATLTNGDMLIGGEGVSFGTLPETSLDGLLKAEDADLTTLAAIAQKPVWSLAGGQLVNLSADALAEARSTERLKKESIQRALGRSHAQALRLASFIEGREDDASDFGLHANWRDDEARSLSQAADALGKIAQQLGVPASLLWDMIPGVSHTTAEEWRAYAAEHPAVDDVLAAHLTSQDMFSGAVG